MVTNTSATAETSRAFKHSFKQTPENFFILCL